MNLTVTAGIFQQLDDTIFQNWTLVKVGIREVTQKRIFFSKLFE